MKRILITGANSYIGTSLEKRLQQQPDIYQVHTQDMISGAWRHKSFSGYDVIFHVAGIAHVSVNPNLEPHYYGVNRDLAVETAQKAKNDGVKQFIFMSSILVYGESYETITRDTVPQPTNFYGKSKLQAEQGIISLQDKTFKVAILRPPMVYGKGSKGNYPKLAKVARKLSFFPELANQRSMIYIENLCEFVRLIIDNEEYGLFFPQNAEYVKTSEMVRLIAAVHGKQVKLTRNFNPILKWAGNHVGVIHKLFGSLIYEQDLSQYKEKYCKVDLETSIKLTEM